LYSTTETNEFKIILIDNFNLRMQPERAIQAHINCSTMAGGGLTQSGNICAEILSASMPVMNPRKPGLFAVQNYIPGDSLRERWELAESN